MRDVSGRTHVGMGNVVVPPTPGVLSALGFLYSDIKNEFAHTLIRTLEEEIGRVVRGRVVNPKWIAGVMRHGYKGAFEIAATVDYLFAFAATTGAVRDHHFEAVDAVSR